jgi:hydroxylamine reductase (hybrid-cluster protein)
MSTIHNVNTALGKDFTKLSGPENFSDWVKQFANIAIINGYYTLYLGTDNIVEKPKLPVFATPTIKRATCVNADAEIASTINPPANYSYLLAVYNI